MDCPFVKYESMTWVLGTVGKIIFEFVGGCTDGRSVEGGDNARRSSECLDPVMNYWIDSYSVGSDIASTSKQTEHRLKPTCIK